jgi:hypothetical protein
MKKKKKKRWRNAVRKVSVECQEDGWRWQTLLKGPKNWE